MTSSLLDLSGTVAVITGSSRGIGLASARRMAEHGAKVVICGRKADACEAAAAEINASSAAGEAVAAPCNIGRKEEPQRVIATANAHWGRVDIVKANAAIHTWAGSVRSSGRDLLPKGIRRQGKAFILKYTVQIYDRRSRFDDACGAENAGDRACRV